MAVDPRILLSSQPLNIGQRFAQNLQNLQQQDLLGTRRDQAPLLQQQLQQQTDLLTAQQPAQLQAAERAGSGQAQVSAQQQQAQQIATNYATAIKPLMGNPQALVIEMERQKALMASQQIDTSGIDEDIAQIQTPDGLKALRDEVDQTLSLTGNMQKKSAEQREFENLVNVAQNPNSTQLEKNSANRALGNLAKVSISAAERIAGDPLLSDAIADVEGKKATAREEGKLKKQLKFKPRITKAVKLAEKAAIERGEVLTDLARMEAALPDVLDAVNQLKELAPIATSTLGGRAFDFAVKESGFGSTEGANARAKFIAIVSNQVLPLLKPTFGAAFTVPEGDQLRATLGDPDASPAQKIEQLNAFIDQKQRSIRTAARQVDAAQDAAPTGAQEGATATNPQTGQTAVFTNGQWVVQ